MAAPSVAAPELRAPSPPASTYATTPLELADVLAQLPPDVVDANVWARTDNVHAFKLTSRAARQLVHATKRCVDLGPSCWTGCPSGDGAAAAPGMVAALSRYTVLDTLTAKADVAAEPERACRRRPAAPWVSTPSKLAEKPQASRVVDFLAAGSLSQLRTVELRLGRALGLDVAALAVLPHLTSCGVYFASASEAAFQLEVDAAGMLSKGLLTLQLGLDRVERAVAGGSGIVAAAAPQRPMAVHVSALGALSRLETLAVWLPAPPPRTLLALRGLPASLRTLRYRCAAVDASSWRAQARLPQLSSLFMTILALPLRCCPLLPATIKELQAAHVPLQELPQLVAAMARLEGASMVLHTTPANGDQRDHAPDISHDDDGSDGEVGDDGGGGGSVGSTSNPFVALRRLAHYVACLDLRLAHLTTGQLRALLDAEALPALAPVLWSLELELLEWRISQADVQRLRQQLAACCKLQAVEYCTLYTSAAQGIKNVGSAGIVAALLDPDVLPQLRTLRLDVRSLKPAPKGGPAEMLRACLAARAARGLPPLELHARLLRDEQASAIQASVQLGGCGCSTKALAGAGALLAGATGGGPAGAGAEASAGSSYTIHGTSGTLTEVETRLQQTIKQRDDKAQRRRLEQVEHAKLCVRLVRLRASIAWLDRARGLSALFMYFMWGVFAVAVVVYEVPGLWRRSGRGQEHA